MNVNTHSKATISYFSYLFSNFLQMQWSLPGRLTKGLVAITTVTFTKTSAPSTEMQNSAMAQYPQMALVQMVVSRSVGMECQQRPCLSVSSEQFGLMRTSALNSEPTRSLRRLPAVLQHRWQLLLQKRPSCMAIPKMTAMTTKQRNATSSMPYICLTGIRYQHIVPFADFLNALSSHLFFSDLTFFLIFSAS